MRGQRVGRWERWLGVRRSPFISAQCSAIPTRHIPKTGLRHLLPGISQVRYTYPVPHHPHRTHHRTLSHPPGPPRLPPSHTLQPSTHILFLSCGLRVSTLESAGLRVCTLFYETSCLVGNISQRSVHQDPSLNVPLLPR